MRGYNFKRYADPVNIQIRERGSINDWFSQWLDLFWSFLFSRFYSLLKCSTFGNTGSGSFWLAGTRWQLTRSAYSCNRSCRNSHDLLLLLSLFIQLCTLWIDIFFQYRYFSASYLSVSSSGTVFLARGQAKRTIHLNFVAHNTFAMLFKSYRSHSLFVAGTALWINPNPYLNSNHAWIKRGLSFVMLSCWQK